MPVHQLPDVDAFVVIDLPGANAATGIVRAADKVLTSSATEIARCTTYAYASLEMERSGASAGISAPEGGRAAAIAAFVAAAGPLVENGAYFPDAGKGVDVDDLAPLRAHDPRAAIDTNALVAAAGLGALEALHIDLADARVVIEGMSLASVPLVASLNEQGARVVALSTEHGTAINDVGFDTVAITEALQALGDRGVEKLTDTVVPANRVLGVECDVLFVSRLGLIDEVTAPFVKARAVVPLGPSPFTAKGYITLQRAGTVVVPDFVTMAAPLAAAWRVDDPVGSVRSIIHEVADHEDGLYLGACYRAEAFLSRWQDKLPFGRPFAS